MDWHRGTRPFSRSTLAPVAIARAGKSRNVKGPASPFSAERALFYVKLSRLLPCSPKSAAAARRRVHGFGWLEGGTMPRRRM